MMVSRKSGVVLAAAAAALFAAGTVATVSSPAQAEVKCTGANACKGTSACKTASSACKGQNACKGQGWVEAKDEATCSPKGRKVAS